MDIDVQTITGVSKKLTGDQNMQDISSQEKPADVSSTFIASSDKIGIKQIASNAIKKVDGERFPNKKGGTLLMPCHII